MTYQHLVNYNHLPFEQHLLRQLTYELQWHSTFMLTFVLEGNVNVQLSGRGHLLSKNDLFFLKPFETYSFITNSEEIHLLSFFIDADFIMQLCPDFDRISFDRSYLRSNLENEHYYQLCSHIAQIILHSMKHGTCEKLKSLTAITNILILLIESFGEKQKEAILTPNYTQERTAQIISYINEHYSHKISLENISDFLGIHPQYFSFFFKKQFKKNFTDYLVSYRISRSISSLLQDTNSILDLAISFGFNNHKTYSSAFKKIYGMTPTDFRKEHSESSLLTKNTSKTNDGYFSFFQPFWSDEALYVNNHRLQTHMPININLLNLPLKTIRNEQPIFIDAGRASSCLRNEVQEQIKTAKKDFDFDYLRIRDIFSDDLFVYYEESDKVPIFNWQYLDIIFDFFLSIQIKPFIEIGFMPRHLASKNQHAGWHFHPNVSFPKSLDKWNLLITNFMIHCMERYGIGEVRTWYFDFWTCPDLPIKDGYWNESMEKFFEFYHTTYGAIKSIDSQIRFGSPIFSTPLGYDWYESFFVYCKEHHLRPSYISLHAYGCDAELESNQFISYFNEFQKTPILPEKTCISNKIAHIQNLMDLHGFGNEKIIISSWSISFYPKDLTRDTCFMGPYIAYVSIATMDQVFGLCYRSLSDIHEDFFPSSTLFGGGSGMMDFHGLKKASYNTFYLFRKLGKIVIERNENYIVTKSDRGYQLLVFNLAYYDTLYRLSNHSALSYTQRYNVYETTDNLMVHIMLTLDPGSYSVKKSTVNQNAGSAYDLWVAMGSPENLTIELVEYIKNKSIPEIFYSTEIVTSNLVLEVTIPPHGVVLFEIEKKIQ